VALFGANVAAPIDWITLHAHGETGLRDDELLMLLLAAALQ
jgi:hypothetical protein